MGRPYLGVSDFVFIRIRVDGPEQQLWGLLVIHEPLRNRAGVQHMVPVGRDDGSPHHPQVGSPGSLPSQLSWTCEMAFKSGIGLVPQRPTAGRGRGLTGDTGE